MKKIHNFPCEVCGKDTGSSVLMDATAKQSEIDRKIRGYKHAKCAEKEQMAPLPFLANASGGLKEDRLKAFAERWDGKAMTQDAIMEMFSIMKSQP